jgi:hypothetical protein
MTFDPVLVFIARGAIALLFLAAAVSKLADFVRFRVVLAGYGVPEAATMLVGALIVAAELVAGIGAVSGFVQPLWLAAALLATYAGAMAVGLVNGRRADCGCSLRAQPTSWALVVRNVFLVGIAAFASTSPSARTLGVFDYVIVAGAIVVAALLYLSANELIAARDRMEEWI